MKVFFKKHKIAVIITAAVIVTTALVATLFTVLKKNAELDREQAEFIEKLELTAGSYDENNIVLSGTNKYEAEALAKKLGAKLRISFDGRFAVLYLQNGQTILDVCCDDEYKKYIAAFTPDYMATVADIEEEEEAEKVSIHIPRRPEYEVTDEFYSQQTYLDYLNLGDVWKDYKGAGLTIAVIDTGIDTGHSEFAGRISEWSYNATYDKIVKDYGNDWSLIKDTQGHGTSVAGVIGAAMDGNGMTGILPEAELLVIKAECDSAGNFLRVSDLVFGLYYAIERDADIVNMSFAVIEGIPFIDAVDLAFDSDVICVAAAGNDSSCMPMAPASFVTCLGVGALEEDGWGLASYSNYGENVNITAPGTVFTTAVGGGYRYISGTSFSASIISGCVGLYKQLAGPYLTYEHLLKQLHATCYDLGDPGPDWFCGYGAIDVYALIREVTGTVTFNMMTDELDDVSVLFVHGHPVQDIPEPERLYAVFDGWYYDPQFKEELNWFEDKYYTDTTLYAKWANEDDTIPFDYRILEDGTVEITGYKGKRRYITIPDYIEGRQVSSIGACAFQGNSRLLRVLFPRYLKNIGNKAFDSCINILNWDLPDGVVNIGSLAFADNARLSSINLGNSLKTVGSNAFSGCGLLTSIYFPKTLQSIDGSAFTYTTSMMQILVDEQCENYTSYDGVLYNKSRSTLIAYPAARTVLYKLPDEATTVAFDAFCASKTSYVDLNSVVYIEDEAFLDASLVSVTIPDTCIYLGDGAFNKNVLLKTAVIGRGITELNKGVFSFCTSLEKIFIHNGITAIHYKAFWCDGSLSELTFEAGSKLTLIDEYAFTETGLISVDFPDSLVYIMDKAFYKCGSLKTISFGENSDLQLIGSYAFANTVSMRKLDLPKKLRSLGSYSFFGSGLRNEILLPASLVNYGAGAFAACRGVTSFAVEDGNEVYDAADGVLYNIPHTSLWQYPAGRESVEYTPLDTTVIVEEASFYGNWYVENITLPNSVTDIMNSAFFDCRFMYEYVLSENLVNMGDSAFGNNQRLPQFNVTDKVRRIGKNCFAGDMRLLHIYINDTSEMTRISYQAFADCGIEEFRIPANISSVAQYAFEGCRFLQKVTFAENSRLQSISAYFFLGCDSIREIIFEEGSALKSIQAHGFQGMRVLQRIDFGDAQIENIDNYAFRMCPRLSELNLPDTLKSIGRFAFYRCEDLRELTVPEAIEHIGEYAFFGTRDFKLYFKSELLPIYLDENWDNGITSYFTGVTEIIETENWQYANLKNGTVSIIKYLGNESNIDLSGFEYGTVSVIGGYAFSDKSLQTVVLPESLEQIQRFAFVGCKELQSVIIPENVTFIAQHAFENTGIKTLSFEGNGIKVIEYYAFAYTRELKSVTLPGSLEKLGKYAFYSSGIESLAFSEGYHLDTVPEGCFAETKLRSVTVPDCTKVIDHNAFSHNHELKSVDLGAGEDLMIMSNVFYNTGLESVHIGANVGFIGEYAFMDLDSLTAFTVDENNPYYSEIDGVLFNKDGTKLVSMPAGRTGSYMIAKEVEILGFGAFENSKLSEITVEEGSRLVTFGYRVFYGAKNLTSFVIPKGVVSIDYYAFAECDKLKTVTFEEGNRLSGIYEGAFFGCRSLENITLPDTVVEISDYAFYACESLDVLPLSSTTGVLGIYDYAFAYTGITELDLSPTIVDIGAYAFQGIKIHDLVVAPSDYRQLVIGIGAFADCDMIENVTLPFTGQTSGTMKNNWFGFIFGSGYPTYDPEFVPESIKYIKITNQTSFNLPVSEYRYSFYRCADVETVILPEDTVYIGEEIFCGFNSLKKFDVPAGITRIENKAFLNCRELKELYLPDCVTYIGKEAFAYCRKLENLRIGDCLEEIDGYNPIAAELYPGTFEECAIKEIHLPDTLTKIGCKAFINCISLENIKIPASVNLDDVYALFENCSSLKKIELNCKTVAERMCSGCSSLEKVVFSSNVSAIGNDAFHGCGKLYDLEIPDCLVKIGDSAFFDCSSMSCDLILPEGCTELGCKALWGTGIRKVVIPTTLNKLGEGVFGFCEDLESVEIKGSIESLPIECFKQCRSLMRVKLPDSLKYIDERAFEGCHSIGKLVLPDSMKIVFNDAFCGASFSELILPESLETFMGDFNFSAYRLINRSNIRIDPNEQTQIYAVVDNDGTRYCSDQYREYDENIIETEDGLMFLPEGEGDDAYYTVFGYTGDAEELTIPGTFNGKPVSVAPVVKISVSSVTIGEGAKDLYLFYYRGRIFRSLTIPSTIQSVCLPDEDVCGHLEELTVTGSGGSYRCVDGILIKDNEVVYALNSLKGEVTIPDGVTKISNAFYRNYGITEVCLPDSLVEIESSFNDCDKLERIVLPPSVKSVTYSFNGTHASYVSLGSCEFISESFTGSRGLETVTVPGTLKEIGCNSFRDCSDLKEIIFENGVETIGSNAFYSSKRYPRIVIPQSVREILNGAFGNAESVELDERNESFTLKDGHVYTSDLSRCVIMTRMNDNHLIIPDGMTVISAEMFEGADIEWLTVPASVKRIEAEAFRACRSLKRVDLPDSLEYIGVNAFLECDSLEEFHIPQNLVDDQFFDISNALDLDHVRKITVDPENKRYIKEDGVIYCRQWEYRYNSEIFGEGWYLSDDWHALWSDADLTGEVTVKDGTTVLRKELFARREVTSVTLPETLIKIESGALGSPVLKNITLPNSLQYIGESAFSYQLESLHIPENVIYIDERMLVGAENLKQLTVDENNSTYCAYGNILYDKPVTKIIIVPETVKGTVTVAEGVKIIQKGSFNEGITEITFPDTLEYAGPGAFGNMNIIRLNIPVSVEYIAPDAFYGSDHLKFIENESDIRLDFDGDIYIPSSVIFIRNREDMLENDTVKYYMYGDYIYCEYVGTDEDIIGTYALNCYIGDETEITLPDEIDGHKVIPYKFESGKASTVIIKPGTRSIPSEAFSGSYGIRHVILPDSIREIGWEAFYQSNLESINLPEGLLNISGSTFEHCNLKEIVIPESVYIIGDGAFYMNFGLENVTLPSRLSYIGGKAFRSCGITSVVLPYGLEYIGEEAFFGCPLESVTIPRSVNMIEADAFRYCPLKEINLPDSRILLKKGAFDGCDYVNDENNWDGDFLYCGNHLLKYRGNDVYVKVERDVATICESAFEGCYNIKYLEISGDAYGALQPQYVPSLTVLIVRKTAEYGINAYFADTLKLNVNYDNPEFRLLSVPDNLKAIVLEPECYINYKTEFFGIGNITIFVNGLKADCPWDRIAPGWNNGNTVTYGDKWYMAEFYDRYGRFISLDCFRNSQAIRPPYVVLPDSGDTAYTHIGWDIDGDGEPDGMPASRLSDVKAYAVVVESKPAYYTVKFMDMDRKTVIDRCVLEYGQQIIPPESVPEKKGYTFVGWENYEEDMTVNTDTKIYSVWKHDGEGHNYVQNIIPPTCTEKGYTLHKCSICDDEFRTDYVDELWHNFGEWITDKEPSCSELGARHRVCVRCGSEENAVIEKISHTYEYTVLKEATCTEQGVVSCVCTVCNAKTQEPVNVLPHDYQKVYAEKSYIEWLDEEFSGIVWGCDGETYWYYTCSCCGKIQTASAAAVAGVGSTHSHEYSAILNAEGRPVAVRCALCGYVECHEHDCYDSIDENGHPVCICKNCGQVFPKITIIYGDATGDGVINGKDLIRLRKYLASYDPDAGTSDVEIAEGADVNGDGVVNGKDLIRLRKYLAEQDFNSGHSSTAAPGEFMILTIPDKRLLQVK